MAATIRPIDGKSVHQIQSGQVIVDLCSVVKELLENSIDAGATNIDVRFKNQGLDLIEVQDNGSGISPDNYAFVALKHHTSKLSTFADIASLQTFGFRGEALASLCALSNLNVTTCVQANVPKGSRLSFEPSGRLGGVCVAAAQRGTIVSVEGLFHNLPVRRRELERNIKREWQKVVALLGQYACIQTNVKLSVSQQPTKGKRVALFSTKGNPTTRENIINIFGAKTMSALVSLDLELDMQPTTVAIHTEAMASTASNANVVHVVGHISRPSPGDGRQTPDRQWFFVNGRPCGLPQFAKVFNEVYRSFNYSQSPFIFADIRLDTELYDVNVSPDKRSILLHDQSRLIDTLRTSLTTLLGSHDCAVPVSQLGGRNRGRNEQDGASGPANPLLERGRTPNGKVHLGDNAIPDVAASDSDEDTSSDAETTVDQRRPMPSGEQTSINRWVLRNSSAGGSSTPPIPGLGESYASSRRVSPSTVVSSTLQGNQPKVSRPVRDFNSRLADNTATLSSTINCGGGETDSSMSKKSDDEDEFDEESRIHAVQPQRPSKYDSAHLSPVKTRLGRPARKMTGHVSPTSDGHPLLPMGRIPAECDDLGSQESSSQSNGAIPPRDSDEADGPLGNPDKLELSFGLPSSLARSDVSPSDVMVDESSAESSPSDGGPEINQRCGVIADQPTHESPGEEFPRKSPTITDDITRQSQPVEVSLKRGNTLWQVEQRLYVDEDGIQSRVAHLGTHVWTADSASTAAQLVEDVCASDAESKLTLTISRTDFSAMRVVGQFNLGFIIAVRPGATGVGQAEETYHDELFIIDQHASDEKYNFERLQTTTIVQSQRLVHPRKLQLTALEEEIVMANLTTLEANGFKIVLDASGESPVGSRCEVLALPLSRETTFSLEDLEELIALLGDEPGESDHIPRPSKVRKMFAMRACRGSVMIGRALTRTHMCTLVRQLGQLDKPWNCPHGRPTMRHLCRLQAWDEKRWAGDVVACSHEAWQSYAKGK